MIAMPSDEIRTIKSQFLANHWPQFLESIQISGLRGWNGQSIEFKFPIVAIVGENGTGKSTLLKAAACAYNDGNHTPRYYPSSFFAPTYWDVIEGVILAYKIRVGNRPETFKITKHSRRWSFPEELKGRDVYFYDIARTLPLDATAGYAKIAKLTAKELSSSSLQTEYTERLSYVLGRSYLSARFVQPDINVTHEVGLLQKDFGEMSQFHQGAGEATTLDLFNELQNIPDYSLLIIDEIEASLHPRAQRRLVEFLLWLCRKKRLQIIVSTHSPYILQELPEESRILIIPGNQGLNILNGISWEFALSRIDDMEVPEVNIFVEDRVAAILLREIIVTDPAGSELLRRVSFNSVGPANVVQTLGKLGFEGKLPYKSLAVVDGEIDETEGCIKLPGGDCPEKVVFRDLKAKDWNNLIARFDVGAGDLFTDLDDAMLIRDHHNWTAYVGDRIRKSSISVWEVLANEWCKQCLLESDRDRIISAITDVLNQR